MTLKLADLIQRKADLVWGQGIVELADNGRGGWDAWIRVGADIPKAWQHGIIDYQFAVTPTCTAEDGFRFETSKPTVRTHVPDTWIGSIPWLGKEIEDVGRAILQAEAEARADFAESRGNFWEFACVAVFVLACIAFIAGTAIGSKGRKHADS